MNLIDNIKRMDESIKAFECKNPNVAKVVITNSEPKIPSKLRKTLKENNYKISKKVKINERADGNYKVTFSVLHMPKFKAAPSMKSNITSFMEKLDRYEERI